MVDCKGTGVGGVSLIPPSSFLGLQGGGVSLIPPSAGSVDLYDSKDTRVGGVSLIPPSGGLGLQGGGVSLIPPSVSSVVPVSEPGLHVSSHPAPWLHPSVLPDTSSGTGVGVDPPSMTSSSSSTANVAADTVLNSILKGTASPADALRVGEYGENSPLLQVHLGTGAATLPFQTTTTTIPGLDVTTPRHAPTFITP